MGSNNDQRASNGDDGLPPDEGGNAGESVPRPVSTWLAQPRNGYAVHQTRRTVLHLHIFLVYGRRSPMDGSFARHYGGHIKMGWCLRRDSRDEHVLFGVAVGLMAARCMDYGVVERDYLCGSKEDIGERGAWMDGSWRSGCRHDRRATLSPAWFRFRQMVS